MPYWCSPNECAYCYTWDNAIVLLDKDGNCSVDHTKFGPASHFA